MPVNPNQKNPEQVKTNQLLEKVVVQTTESKGKMDELIQAVQLPSQYEEEAVAASKQSTNLDEKAQKHDKQTLKQDKGFHKEFDEFSKKDILHNQFIEGTEKKKEGLAKAALADKKRKDKFSTRMAKGTWDWTKDKVKGLGKSIGSFLGNIAKLLLLVGAWFVLNWLKGKDLKTIWEDLKKKIDELIKEYIPKWIRDLSFGEALGLAIGSFITAWYAIKATFWAAGRTLNFVGRSIAEAFGTKGGLHSQLTKMNTKLTNLLAKQNAIKTALKFVTNLEAKSTLALELTKTNEQIKALKDEIKLKTSAIQNAESMAENLKAESKIGKQLKTTNKALLKLATKTNAITESLKWAQNFSIESKLGKDLTKANAEYAKLTQTKTLSERALRTAKYNISQVKTGGVPLKPGQFINKAGQIMQVTEGGGASYVEGSTKVPLDEKGMPKDAKASSWWERIKARVSGSATVESAKSFGEWFKGTALGKVGGVVAKTGIGAGNLMWNITRIINPLRGAFGAWKAARKRGANPFVAFMEMGAGGAHGVLDLAPMVMEFVEFLGSIGINAGLGMAEIFGADPKMIDEWITNVIKYRHFASSKVYGWNEDLFGKWTEGTDVLGQMKKQHGTKEQFSQGDFFFGLGQGGEGEGKEQISQKHLGIIDGLIQRWDAMGTAWGSLWALEQEEQPINKWVRLKNIQIERLRKDPKAGLTPEMLKSASWMRKKLEGVVAGDTKQQFIPDFGSSEAKKQRALLDFLLSANSQTTDLVKSIDNLNKTTKDNDNDKLSRSFEEYADSNKNFLLKNVGPPDGSTNPIFNILGGSGGYVGNVFPVHTESKILRSSMDLE